MHCVKRDAAACEEIKANTHVEQNLDRLHGKGIYTPLAITTCLPFLLTDSDTIGPRHPW